MLDLFFERLSTYRQSSNCWVEFLFLWALFLSFAFHLSPPDTFSSFYLLFGLFLSLHRNHPHRGACHLYLLISSIPVPLGALLHLNVRLMRPPHPPDTSAQRPLKAFVEEGESAGGYKLKAIFKDSVFKGKLLAKLKVGVFSYGWLPPSGLVWHCRSRKNEWASLRIRILI